MRLFLNSKLGWLVIRTFLLNVVFLADNWKLLLGWGTATIIALGYLMLDEFTLKGFIVIFLVTPVVLVSVYRQWSLLKELQKLWMGFRKIL